MAVFDINTLCGANTAMVSEGLQAAIDAIENVLKVMSEWETATTNANTLGKRASELRACRSSLEEARNMIAPVAARLGERSVYSSIERAILDLPDTRGAEAMTETLPFDHVFDALLSRTLHLERLAKTISATSDSDSSWTIGNLHGSVNFNNYGYGYPDSSDMSSAEQRLVEDLWFADFDKSYQAWVAQRHRPKGTPPAVQRLDVEMESYHAFCVILIELLDRETAIMALQKAVADFLTKHKDGLQEAIFSTRIILLAEGKQLIRENAPTNTSGPISDEKPAPTEAPAMRTDYPVRTRGELSSIAFHIHSDLTPNQFRGLVNRAQTAQKIKNVGRLHWEDRGWEEFVEQYCPRKSDGLRNTQSDDDNDEDENLDYLEDE